MSDLTWLDRLAEDGYCLQEAFLGQSLAAQAREEAVQIFAAGLGRAAMVGSAAQAHSEIRRDEICWLDPQQQPPAMTEFLARMEALRQDLNRYAYLGLRRMECHAAMYRPGGFYKAHKDVFVGKEARVVTFVYFLNPQWCPEHAGELQFIEPLSLTVAPLMDRLVLFKSRDFLHQVLSTHADRYTLTGWMHTDE